jgi:hypothetical protein
MRFALIDEFSRSILTSHHVQSHASFLKAGLIAGAVAPISARENDNLRLVQLTKKNP